MNFQEFTQQLPELRRRHPHALDLTETRVSRLREVLHRELAAPELELPAAGHRCHVAQAWLSRLQREPLFEASEDAGGPQVALNQVLVSRGVRHSLSVLFEGWTTEGAQVAVPNDIYPVYHEIARSACLQVVPFDSRAGCDFRDLRKVQVVLLANPLKPRGDRLAQEELATLMKWLAEDPARRVVIDAVYDLHPRLQPESRVLFATGQAIVLHSLSKAWLEPLLAGIALVPEADAQRWEKAFRAQSVDRAALAKAEALMRDRADFPQVVHSKLQWLVSELDGQLSAKGLVRCPRVGPPVPGYLFPVHGGLEHVLAQGVLGLPASVFGSSDAEVTVVSSLGLLPAL